MLIGIYFHKMHYIQKYTSTSKDIEICFYFKVINKRIHFCFRGLQQVVNSVDNYKYTFKCMIVFLV